MLNGFYGLKCALLISTLGVSWPSQADAGCAQPLPGRAIGPAVEGSRPVVEGRLRGAAAVTAPDALPAADSPIGAVRRLIGTYSGRSIEPYANLLTADFRFFSDDPEFRAAYPAGFSPGDEIAAAEHLFRGFTNRMGVRLPGARAIEIETDTLWAAADRARPESVAWCQIVVAENLRLRVSLEGGGGFSSPPSRHEFHVVRADAAARVPGEPADPGQWLVQWWVENPETLRAAVRVPVATPAPASPADSTRRAAAAAPRRLAFLRLPNPARGPIRLRIALAERGDARIEVFDVQGRRVSNRDLGERDPGEYEVLATGGVAPAPGSYWIRMTQGRRTITTRIAVLR